MRVNILGVHFDNMTMAEAVAEGTRLLSTTEPHAVVTPNPEIVELCLENEALRETVNQASLVLPDGIGVIYGAKLLGTPLKQRVPGIEFGMEMLKVCADTGKRVFLLGAKPGVAEEAARCLQKQYDGLVICGTQDGYFQDGSIPAKAIREAETDLLFVCLGAPKQELWMKTYGEECGAKLMLGLGGSLDVFAGVAKRAPQFYIDHNLEWFYRLLKNPTRFKRMLKLPLFLVHVLLKGKQ